MQDRLLECLDFFEDFCDDGVGHVRVGEKEGGLMFQGEPPGFLYGKRSRVQGMLTERMTERMTEPVMWQMTVPGLSLSV